MKSETMRQDKLGGVDQSHRPEVGSARKIVNMAVDDLGAWKTCGGSAEIDPASPVISGFTSTETVFSFTQKGGRHWLLYEARTAGELTLKAKNGRDSFELQAGRHDSFSPWFKTQYMPYGEWCYVFNGVNAPVRWNGRRLSPVGFVSRPSAPSLVGPLDDIALVDCVSRHPKDPRFMHLQTNQFRRFAVYEEDRGVGEFPADRDVRIAQVENPDAEDTFEIDFKTDEDIARNDNAFAWHYGYVVTWINDLGMESEGSRMAFIPGRNKPVNHYSQLIDLSERLLGGDISVAFARVFLGKKTSTSVARVFYKRENCRNDARGRTFVQVNVTAAPDNVRAIRVYRTENLVPVATDGVSGLTRTDEILRRQNVYLVAESQGCMGFQFADGTPDQLLGPMLDTKDLGKFPAQTKRAALFMGRMFTFGDENHPNEIRYSAATFIEQFPKKNQIFAGNAASGRIMAMHATSNALYVLKERGVYIVFQEGENFRINTVTEEAGCASPNGVFSIPNAGTLFIGEKGIYLLGASSSESIWEGAQTGNFNVVKISDSINRWWEERVVKSALVRACGVVNTSSDEVWMQLPVDDGAESNYGLVFHYKTGAFSFREGFKITSFARTNDHRDLLYLGMYDHDPTAGGTSIHHYSWAFSPPVISSYACSPLDFGSAYDRTDILYFTPFLVAYGDRQLTLNYREERKQTNVLTSAETRNALNTEEPLDKWGTAVFSATEIWQSYEATQVRFPVDAHALEWDFELQSTKLALIGYDLGVAPKQSATSIMRLDSAISFERP